MGWWDKAKNYTKTAADRAVSSTPIGGVAKAAYHGVKGDWKGAAEDLARGYSFGTYDLAKGGYQVAKGDTREGVGSLTAGLGTKMGDVLGGAGGMAGGTASTTPTGLAAQNAGQMAASVKTGDWKSMASDATTGGGTNADLDALRKMVLASLGQQAPQMAGTRIDTAGSDEMHTRQLALLSALEGAAAGKTPSVAELQLRQQADQNARAQLALMASGGRGGNVGLMRRQAGLNMAAIGNQTNADAALLRAQEIGAARGQLGDTLSGMRSADIGLATAQAGLDNSAATTNLEAVLKARGLDVQTLSALLGSYGSSEQIAQQEKDRKMKEDAATLGALGTLGGAAISSGAIG